MDERDCMKKIFGSIEINQKSCKYITLKRVIVVEIEHEIACYLL